MTGNAPLTIPSFLILNGRVIPSVLSTDGKSKKFAPTGSSGAAGGSVLIGLGAVVFGFCFPTVST